MTEKIDSEILKNAIFNELLELIHDIRKIKYKRRERLIDQIYSLIKCYKKI